MPLWCSGSTPFCQDGSTGSIPVWGASMKLGSANSECGTSAFRVHTSELMMARYANWQSDQAQTLESVGSTPTRATANSEVGTRNAELKAWSFLLPHSDFQLPSFNEGDVAQLAEAAVSEAVRCGFDSH